MATLSTQANIERDQYSRTYKWIVQLSDGRNVGAATLEMAKAIAFGFTATVYLKGKQISL